MLFAAFMIFFVSLVFGIILLDSVLHDKPAPIIYVYCHDLISWVGIGMLSTAMYYGQSNPVLLASLTIFIFSALTGLVLFTLYMCKNYLPKSIVIIQNLAGFIALGLLTYHIWFQQKTEASIYAEQQVTRPHTLLL